MRVNSSRAMPYARNTGRANGTLRRHNTDSATPPGFRERFTPNYGTAGDQHEK